jgi:hypothetical protein
LKGAKDICEIVKKTPTLHVEENWCVSSSRTKPITRSAVITLTQYETIFFIVKNSDSCHRFPPELHQLPLMGVD